MPETPELDPTTPLAEASLSVRAETLLKLIHVDVNTATLATIATIDVGRALPGARQWSMRPLRELRGLARKAGLDLVNGQLLDARVATEPRVTHITPQFRAGETVPHAVTFEFAGMVFPAGRYVAERTGIDLGGVEAWHVRSTKRGGGVLGRFYFGAGRAWGEAYTREGRPFERSSPFQAARQRDMRRLAAALAETMPPLAAPTVRLAVPPGPGLDGAVTEALETLLDMLQGRHRDLFTALQGVTVRADGTITLAESGDPLCLRIESNGGPVWSSDAQAPLGTLTVPVARESLGEVARWIAVGRAVARAGSPVDGVRAQLGPDAAPAAVEVATQSYVQALLLRASQETP